MKWNLEICSAARATRCIGCTVIDSAVHFDADGLIQAPIDLSHLFLSLKLEPSIAEIDSQIDRPTGL